MLSLSLSSSSNNTCSYLSRIPSVKIPSVCKSILRATINATYATAAGSANSTRTNARPTQPLNGRSVAYVGSPPFTVGSGVACSVASAYMAGSSTTTTNYQNLSIILSSAILAVIGLGVLVVIFLVNRSLKKQNEGEPCFCVCLGRAYICRLGATPPAGRIDFEDNFIWLHMFVDCRLRMICIKEACFCASPKESQSHLLVGVFLESWERRQV